MLAIRLQRTGRKGHAQFRVVVQDSRRSPAGGKVVAFLGSYNPHTKQAQLDSEKASFYLENGAQPSNRVAILLKENNVKLPDWVKIETSKKRTVKNPEKYGSGGQATEAASSEPSEEATPAQKDSAADVVEETQEAPKEEAAATPEESAQDDSASADDSAEADGDKAPDA